MQRLLDTIENMLKTMSVGNCIALNPANVSHVHTQDAATTDAAIRWKVATFDELDSRELFGLQQLKKKLLLSSNMGTGMHADRKDLQSIHILANSADEVLAYMRVAPIGDPAFLHFNFEYLSIHPDWVDKDLEAKTVELGMQYIEQIKQAHPNSIGPKAYLMNQPVKLDGIKNLYIDLHRI